MTHQSFVAILTAVFLSIQPTVTQAATHGAEAVPSLTCPEAKNQHAQAADNQQQGTVSKLSLITNNIVIDDETYLLAVPMLKDCYGLTDADTLTVGSHVQVIVTEVTDKYQSLIPENLNQQDISGVIIDLVIMSAGKPNS